MRLSALTSFALIPFLLIGCSKYEKENTHLKEELKMVREDSDYLKAEIVGLKKELVQLTAKVDEERNTLQKRYQEEREQLQKKFKEERELLQKRTQEALKKKNGDGKKEATPKEATMTVKKEQKEPTAKAAVVRSGAPRPPQPVKTAPRE
jgi:hypothetical protein